MIAITLKVTNILILLKIVKRRIPIESQQRIPGIMRWIIILNGLWMQINHDEFNDAGDFFAFICYLLDLLLG